MVRIITWLWGCLMKSSTWNRQWVVGIFSDIEQAEKCVLKAEHEGIAPDEFVVIEPDSCKQAPVADIKPEEHHPEWRWIVLGAAIGFIVASLGGWLLLDFSAQSGSAAMDWTMGLVRGLGGGVVGAMVGLITSGSDTSLHAYYEECGLDTQGKVLIGIECRENDEAQILHAETIFRECGVMPHDLPPFKHIEPIAPSKKNKNEEINYHMH